MWLLGVAVPEVYIKMTTFRSLLLYPIMDTFFFFFFFRNGTKIVSYYLCRHLSANQKDALDEPYSP